MIPNSFTRTLAEFISDFHESDAIIRSRIEHIHEEVLRNSEYIRQPNFTSIHRHDLESLFEAYDVYVLRRPFPVS